MKKFTEPEIEISKFEAEDVIATSGETPQTFGLGDDQLKFG